MQQAHASALAQKHAGLDAKIEEERLRPSPDQMKISELKKRKLKLKEELSNG
ncbi:MAG: DUF465 domain-containing protein [Parasphingopyxis sp.]|uniref:DUF465 domain-containing protein n=1 Tax=Parasphingopyxis sp. TaxID=1920299 RepID=UPI00263541AD|nr:DUF465 domain-containing protein [uncultured Parasphingopyxis sp.]